MNHGGILSETLLLVYSFCRQYAGKKFNHRGHRGHRGKAKARRGRFLERGSERKRGFGVEDFYSLDELHCEYFWLIIAAFESFASQQNFTPNIIFPSTAISYPYLCYLLLSLAISCYLLLSLALLCEAQRSVSSVVNRSSSCRECPPR